MIIVKLHEISKSILIIEARPRLINKRGLSHTAAAKNKDQPN